MSLSTVNDTSAFYRGQSASLFWEQTIAQSLAKLKSSYVEALVEPAAYGAKLARFITERIELGPQARLAEVGGGYGTLMEAFTGTVRVSQLTMVDISPRFLQLQRERLGRRGGVTFVEADVFDWLKNSSDDFELVISNENIGDFPTIEGLDARELRESARRGEPWEESPLGRAARLASVYSLALPTAGPVALNAGALELVEAMAGRTKALFLSEHSATVKLGEPYDFLVPAADGQPRRIELKDHAEYTINFDHVEAVARKVGFEVERLPMVEFLGVRHDDGARFMAAAECVGNEVAETVHEFLHHVKEYECALLTAA